MYRRYFKRMIDISLTLLALPFLLIIFLIIAPLIYLEDKGPIFYNALRLGRNGKLFKMYKFRSMKVNAQDLRNKDGSTYSADDDPRLTIIGRIIRNTSLDETPQLINVLKGDMSIVGPRPTILTSNFQNVQGIRRKRYEVRPGITGFTQAYFRNSISQKEKFEYDAYYVENVSFVLDLRIFFKTIKSVFMKENIYTNFKEK